MGVVNYRKASKKKTELNLLGSHAQNSILLLNNIQKTWLNPFTERAYLK